MTQIDVDESLLKDIKTILESNYFVIYDIIDSIKIHIQELEELDSCMNEEEFYEQIDMIKYLLKELEEIIEDIFL